LSNCIHWTITCAPLRLGDLLGIVGRQLLGNGREERGVYTLSTSLRSHFSHGQTTCASPSPRLSFPPRSVY
jgi:hypothetical protein